MRLERTAPIQAGQHADPMARLAAPLHALLRIGAALLFMEHGAQKLLGWFGGMGPNGGTVPIGSMMGAAGLLELVGGAMLLVGLFTRPIAFLLMGEMIVAYGMAHMPNGAVPLQNKGELALLYALVFAFLVGSGAGPLSLDRVLSRRRAGTAPTKLPTSGVPSGRRDAA